MGKSRAEIQRDYRKRLKEKLGEEYNRRERDRMRASYVSSSQLSEKKRKERNQKNKIRNRLCRQRMRERLNLQHAHEDTENECTSGYSSTIVSPEDSSKERLIVRLPCLPMTFKSNGPKKARARALARAHRTIKGLREEQLKLQKRLACKRKQIERLTKKMKATQKSTDSPGHKTECELSKLQLSPSKRRIVKRKLLFANVLLNEFKLAKESTSTKRRKILHKLIAGKVARKYRCINVISQETGLSRSSLSRCQSKDITYTKERRSRISRKMEDRVIEFLSREDNSRTQPGKSDVKKSLAGTKHQTLVLTDYLRNLFQKFKAEYPDIQVSFATFCRLRPRHILLAKYISRNACQCLRHQNMAFKVQALRKNGVKISENPENILVHENNLDDLFKCIESDTVLFKIWKKVELENKQKKMKVIEQEANITVFKDKVTQEVGEFSSHVQRLRAQFQQLKVNKETLKEHHMIVQMDFAENFSCRSLDEVQTAYWNQSSVTLHPVVAYFKSDGELKHKSMVIISDEMAHSASTVYAFIDAIIPELKKIDPELLKLHYWTDSPSSQYRNRFIFNILSKHEALYGCAAQWNYFEAGHGKSACHGLGGTTKRLADEAIRQGNATIQDAHDFYAWALQSNMRDVKFVFVGKDACKIKADEFSNLSIKPVKNTMKLHAISVCKEHFMTRTTSCYCENCIVENFCSDWNVENFGIHVRTDVHKVNVTDQEDMVSVENTVFRDISVGDFVAARYERDWYIGKVEEIDRIDEDCRVNFMEKAKSLHKWPKSRDELWVNKDDILCKVEEPLKTGKSCRMFKLSEVDLERVVTLFDMQC